MPLVLRSAQVAAQVGAVQEAVARQARDVAGLAEATEEHQAFLRAWRDLLQAQLSAAHSATTPQAEAPHQQG
jgi:DNA/RNA-binding domain of Phe-tRNA-synthetase-like protein